MARLPYQEAVKPMVVAGHDSFESAGIPALQGGNRGIRNAWNVSVHGSRKDHMQLYTDVTGKKTHVGVVGLG